MISFVIFMALLCWTFLAYMKGRVDAEYDFVIARKEELEID
jgi:hypothetical protein